LEALLGSALGGYKLIRSLGSGPTGETYGALDSASAAAAIKVIHPGLSLFTRAEAFWNELRQIGRLAHPHITVASGADWSKSGRVFVAIDGVF
jgi:serine/threonine protein kinase